MRTLWILRMRPRRTPNWTRRCSSMRSACGLKRRHRSRIVVPYVMALPTKMAPCSKVEVSWKDLGLSFVLLVLFYFIFFKLWLLFFGYL